MSRARSAIARLGASGLAALALAGCVGFSPDGGMAPVTALTAARLGQHVETISDDRGEARAVDEAARLLRRPLGAGRAVQVALLRNKEIQATFHDLGVSEAEFVRASLPPEPTISVLRLAGDGDVEIVRQVAVDLFALATLPARRAIAGERFAAAQTRAGGQVVALAAGVARQFDIAVAAQERIGFLDKALAAAGASAEVAKRLGEAGNLNKLEQARQDVFYTELGAERADARIEAQAEREKLTRLMGLWGGDIAYMLPNALPPLPKRIASAHDIEARALSERLDILARRRDLDALARELGLTHATRFVSDLSLSLSDDVERSGPTEPGLVVPQRLGRTGVGVDFTIPIYDFGESRVRGARETYLAAANRLAQRAIDARSEAREAYIRYRGKYDLARYYAERVLPLRKTILDQSTLQYNGMLTDVTQLLLDARGGVASNLAAITARRDFWVADVALTAALTGIGPVDPPSEPPSLSAVSQSAN